MSKIAEVDVEDIQMNVMQTKPAATGREVTESSLIPIKSLRAQEEIRFENTQTKKRNVLLWV